MPPTPFSLVRISTEMFPEKERFSTFREEFVRGVLAMDVIDHSGGRPQADLTFMPLGPIAFGSLVSRPAEFIRCKHHLRDSNDDFLFEIIETGPIQHTHAGEERIYDAGSACFFDQARPWRGFGRAGTGSVRNVVIPAGALKALVRHPEDLAGRPIRPGPALRLLDGYLKSLANLKEPPSAELAPIVGVHLLDLVAAALGSVNDAAELIAQRGVRAARVRAILAETTQRRCDPNFDLDNVAAVLGLSRRYIQQLLEETRKSFTGHLLESRLDRAFAMLTDSRYFHLTIIDIVLAAGFGDVSHFNRVFRRRCGETPSCVRDRSRETHAE